jgi:predicted nucleic acid-binding Zn ribbon protein
MIRCPRCRSTEIYPVAGGYGGYNYRCKKCGYSGALVVEFDDDITPEEERELQKEYREEVQEYEQKRRSLFWIIMALIFIGVILFVRF